MPLKMMGEARMTVYQQSVSLSGSYTRLFAHLLQAPVLENY